MNSHVAGQQGLFAKARELRLRFGRWPRRALALLLFLCAALLAFRGDPNASARATTEAAMAVVVASRDLPAGVALADTDVRLVELPRSMVPSGVLRTTQAAAGRTVAGPLRKGEVVTDVRLIGPAFLASSNIPPHWRASALRIQDAAMTKVLSPGDHIDVVSGAGEVAPETGLLNAGVRLLATDVRLLAVIPGTEAHSSAEGGVVLVVAGPYEMMTELTAVATQSTVGVTLRTRSN